MLRSAFEDLVIDGSHANTLRRKLKLENKARRSEMSKKTCEGLDMKEADASKHWMESDRSC